MAVADYKKYLAENVLNERRTVTYRSLSRALRVHSTLAKQMLYDFHRNENNKKPNSVNATYLLTGIQKAPETTNGYQDSFDENGIPQSSPYLSSSMPNQDAGADDIAVSSILLVREDDLEDAKATFESIASIHVYSLQPTVLQDLNVLTDVHGEMVTNHAQEDPLEHGKSWGMIQGKNVRRRTAGRPPAPAAAPAAPKTTIPAKRPIKSEEKPQPKTDTEEEAPKPKTEPKSQPEPATKREETPTSSKPSEKTAPPKQKGSIFSSFAKAKPKVKKEDSATSTTSAVQSAEPSGAEDVVLGDASDDDEEQEELFPNTGKAAPAGTRESRKEREEKLKKMMEDEDEDEDEEMPDAAQSPEESNPIDEPPPKQPELKEEMTVRGGRRRGRRQIMKKKTVKDDEGYLVTVEEPSWESFSEDEPAPPPKKKPAVSAAKGKPAAKPGQGNIMSFFSKK
ncbi:hypothetical protein BO70DRAFT_360138 [Aspergillus heteromorphus CBS 117.55]|uniref:DNA polymerase delta subunit 3 n=1 Tax=Aspergillus heteromorphus CBS 117.55 TaxID=1448321 RepID=A0A317WM05_9EURO|nr:uncharacterized protein BO70DRAFT_360138 [Aspergillus heteromorphus CBS 117.55]PWY87526.1 hypothetical protein BO70DRAFT_360138 [Aspergillus heteromorphus CBS 117.55]